MAGEGHRESQQEAKSSGGREVDESLGAISQEPGEGRLMQAAGQS